MKLIIHYNNFTDSGLGKKTKVISSDDYDKIIKTFSLWLGQLTLTPTPHPTHAVYSVRWQKEKGDL